MVSIAPPPSAEEDDYAPENFFAPIKTGMCRRSISLHVGVRGTDFRLRLVSERTLERYVRKLGLGKRVAARRGDKLWNIGYRKTKHDPIHDIPSEQSDWNDFWGGRYGPPRVFLEKSCVFLM